MKKFRLVFDSVAAAVHSISIQFFVRRPLDRLWRPVTRQHELHFCRITLLDRLPVCLSHTGFENWKVEKLYINRNWSLSAHGKSIRRVDFQFKRSPSKVKVSGSQERQDNDLRLA